MLPVSRRGYARAVIYLVLSFIAIVALILIAGVLTGVIGTPSTARGSAKVTAGFEVPGGVGTVGTLYFEVQNLGPTQIVGVSVTCPTSQFITMSCGGLAFSYKGVPVSITEPVPPSARTEGNSTVQSSLDSSFSFADTYVVACTVAFSGGGVQTYAVAITPHS